MFLQNAVAVMESLNQLNDAKAALEAKFNELDVVQSFNSIAFELAQALGQLTGTPVYMLEYGSKAFGIKVKDMEFGESGDLYYTLSYQCSKDGVEDEQSQVYSNEIYIPAQVVKSKDPINAAKICAITTNLGYVHSAIHSSAQWIEEKLKEEEDLITKLSGLVGGEDPYSEQVTFSIKKVLDYMYAEKLHKPYEIIRVTANELMKIAEVSTVVDFAHVVSTLINKNIFKRFVTLSNSRGEFVAEYSSYDEVPLEIFDKELGMAVPVLVTQLKTVYEYIG